MCAVSMVHQSHTHIAPNDWDRQGWDAFQRKVKEAKEYDIRTNQPDCLDPEKEKFVKAVEDVLRKKGLI